MSEYLSKKAVLEWLESEMSINKGHPDDIDIHWTLNRVSKKILSGAFDADNTEIQRLRAALERIKKWADDPKPVTMLKIRNLANETLKGKRMISISTLRSKWRCNSCKAPNQNNKYILVTVGEENNILCRDCAETLGIMLLRELENIEEYKRAKEDDGHE